jgi:hypothetical protein
MRTLVALIALALGLERVAGAYPVVIPKVSEAKQREREAEFRRRNPQQFSAVEVNARGFIKRVVTDDPALMPKPTTSALGTPTTDDAPLRAFLRANADLFGFTPDTVDRLPFGGGLLVEEYGGAIVGEIQVSYSSSPKPTMSITVLFWVNASPKYDEATIAKRVIGRSYTQTLGYGRPARRDCAMQDGGKANCKSKTLATRSRTVKLGVDDVRATTWHLPQGNAIRLVTCVDARIGEEPEPYPKWVEKWGDLGIASRRFTPQGGAPKLPLVVDAVTGRTVAINVSSCDDQIFVALRDE